MPAMKFFFYFTLKAIRYSRFDDNLFAKLYKFFKMKKKFIYLILILSVLVATNYFAASQHHESITSADSTTTEETIKQDHASHEKEASHDESENHSGGMEPLFFIIIALLIGAGTRHFLRKSPIPYTVTLLLFGIALGIINRLGYLDQGTILSTLGKSIEWGGHIDPHVILYVFLPTLIFEAAFAMDVHTFKKTLSSAVLLAVPGIIIAMLLSGLIMIGIKTGRIGLYGWTWNIAFMFGAVVSATDPVAVVSLLKELGASKKLGTLIEGESLLNDGTAIVIFMVFYTTLTSGAASTSPVIQFTEVALGGILLGFVIAGATIIWVRRVFNDAMVEITIIVVAAYLTFFIAEYFLHISGVLGLVALGLVMASLGRTRISPEVEHFLHEFWELAAFIANTLIFVIVGVVIAQRPVFTAIDFLILGILYIGIHIVRAIVIAIFFPVMKRLGYGLKRKEAYVIWWGALRGAIGLALALVVAEMDSTHLSQEIRNQFLFLIAGIVALTLVINATTISWLVNKLGLSKIAPAKLQMILNAREYLRTASENSIEKIKKDRFMNRADWNKVKKFLPGKVKKEEYEDNLKVETIAETRRRVLEKEKSSYWRQFKDGLLGATAVQRLSEAVNDILDAGGMISLSERKDLEELWKTPKLLNKMQNLPLIGKVAERWFFDKLSLSYDSARGFVEAQEEAIKLIESLYRQAGDDEDQNKTLGIIEEEINTNRIQGLTFLRNLRKNYPEIYNAISTRQAIRSMLNYERHTVERLQKKGQINSQEASKMLVNIDKRMKRLIFAPPTVQLPETDDILKDIDWLQNVEPDIFERASKYFQTRVYAVDEDLIKEDTPGDSIYILARGNVKVSAKDEVLAILGAGSVFGEMSVLNGEPRTATITAESPVTVLRMRYLKIQRLLRESKNLERNIWNIAGKRYAENILRKTEPYSIWRTKKLKKWISTGIVKIVKEDESIALEGKIAVLLFGEAFDNDKKTFLKAPCITHSNNISLKENGKVFIGDIPNT